MAGSLLPTAQLTCYAVVYGSAQLARLLCLARLAYRLPPCIPASWFFGRFSTSSAHYVTSELGIVHDPIAQDGLPHALEKFACAADTGALLIDASDAVLMAAVYHAWSAQSLAALVAAGADVVFDGARALCYAACMGLEATALTCLRLGVPPNGTAHAGEGEHPATNSSLPHAGDPLGDGMSPLFAALSCGRASIVRMLVGAGASTTLRVRGIAPVDLLRHPLLLSPRVQAAIPELACALTGEQFTVPGVEWLADCAVNTPCASTSWATSCS
ncbi:hypothetical protein EON68_04950 [archaeon]|nr:MAG: hypothetical protein EON68_04950 [archaeon]